MYKNQEVLDSIINGQTKQWKRQLLSMSLNNRGEFIAWLKSIGERDLAIEIAIKIIKRELK